MSAILIVDYEAGVRASLGGVLRDEGYSVDVADSGFRYVAIALTSSSLR